MDITDITRIFFPATLVSHHSPAHPSPVQMAPMDLEPLRQMLSGNTSSPMMTSDFEVGVLKSTTPW